VQTRVLESRNVTGEKSAREPEPKTHCALEATRASEIGKSLPMTVMMVPPEAGPPDGPNEITCGDSREYKNADSDPPYSAVCRFTPIPREMLQFPFPGAGQHEQIDVEIKVELYVGDPLFSYWEIFVWVIAFKFVTQVEKVGLEHLQLHGRGNSCGVGTGHRM